MSSPALRRLGRPTLIRAMAVVWMMMAVDLTSAFQLTKAQSIPNPQATSIHQEERELFAQVRTIFENACLDCHNSQTREGGLSLETSESFRSGGDSGETMLASSAHQSYLIDMVTPDEGRASMPKGRSPLTSDEIRTLTEWINQGAEWPESTTLRPLTLEEKARAWWSYQPLTSPAIPQSNFEGSWSRNAIDSFIAERLQKSGLHPTIEAPKTRLIRRLYADLTGLPPTPEQVARFCNDPQPDAYERLVDELLASPAYGERWARHWLDVVHYADTHGYDKDKPRPNAWPYRDYVIRSFNRDTPYRSFIREQLAGDMLERPAIEALGFLSAGPWDFIGHAEVAETKIDGKVARHLDRDDMVQNTMLTFQSTTAGCAQCHAHKFDPISQEEYYSLQAIFAAIDRTEVEYYEEPDLQRKWMELKSDSRRYSKQKKEIEEQIKQAGGQGLAEWDKKWEQAKSSQTIAPAEHGYHSQIAERPDETKWVQIDLGQLTEIARIEWVGCHDDFNQIGDGFGYPKSLSISLSPDSENQLGEIIAQRAADVSPGIAWQSLDIEPRSTRYVRFTAHQLAERKGDYIFALAEVRILDRNGVNLAIGKSVQSLDSIEAPVRWQLQNLVDDRFPIPSSSQAERDAIAKGRQAYLNAHIDAALLRQFEAVQGQMRAIEQSIQSLPAPKRVYAGAVHFGSGAFVGTGSQGGKPRPIFVLARGDVTKPTRPVMPSALKCFSHLERHFQNHDATQEGLNRLRMAEWIVDPENPLTWRSIVNRLWQYHFGTGLVSTPNDFGRMGGLPSHPELLDYLAEQMRQSQSIKQLQRMIVCSATYRQDSMGNEDGLRIDPENRLLWRVNRRRLEAEAIRDALLHASGHLDRQMGGPGFQDFVMEQPDHSPHYEYHLHDPDDPRVMRRTVYRMIVRSQTQPFLTCLDCADPSLQVDRRNESNSPVQALAMLNDRLALKAAERLAAYLRREIPTSQVRDQLRLGFQRLVARDPNLEELESLVRYAESYGLENACRCLLNLNELIYVD